MDNFDVAIIGAGVIGCALARELRSRQLRVLLIDRASPGAEASCAAAGMLAPSAEAESPSPFFHFALHSRRRFPGFAAELLAETGIDPHYRCEGTLLPFHSVAAGEQLRARLLWQLGHGIRIEELTAAQLHTAEPQLTGGGAPFVGAFHLADDHQVDNRLLMDALVRSCRMRGVVMQLGQPVARIITRAGTAVSLELGSGGNLRNITAGAIINASGAWAAQLAGAGIAPLPIRPVKGHMLALCATSLAGPAALRHVVRTPDVYLVPRHDGRIIVGATMEEAGFDKTIQAAPLAGLLEAAQRACPALARAEWLEAWTGLRPAAPDALPIIGSQPGMANYWTALGHFRNGILLAPATAEVLADWLTRGRPPLDMIAFSPTRFLP